ncbi:hypothetical protein [uncultured Metabacillus sp.]|uniref:hypothetical protein n=1 Tax=uncultured Metabacillus sp. TaxID=2860135 RepID=UPI00260A64C1|nr:hypothetical protein [uncultured Metabacillus sp.]
MGKWFSINDSSSGGKSKTKYWSIYVHGKNEDEAWGKFEDETGFDRYQITCKCCGEDFWISEVEDLEEMNKEISERDCLIIE